MDRRCWLTGVVSLALLAVASSGCSGGASADGATTASAAQGLDRGAYDATAAVTYAGNHWDDGVGLCAEFTSRSLRAGNLDIALITYVPTLVGALASVPFEEHEQGSASVTARAGDAVIFSDDTGARFCDDASSDQHNCGHACIVTVGGSSESSILIDCHNNAHHHIELAYLLGGSYTSYRVYHVAGGGSSAPPGTQACATDDDCNHGKAGTETVCGATAGYCIHACHSDGDCPNGLSCTQTAPHWSCN